MTESLGPEGRPSQRSFGTGIRPLDLTGRERQLRGAILAMERIATSFARYARRSLSFLARHRARIVPGPVQITAGTTDPPNEPVGPTYTLTIGTPDGMGWAAITLNPDAVAATLEGALGGGSTFGSTPLAPELTSAQRALLSRVTRSLATDLSTAIREVVGLTMTLLPGEGAATHGSNPPPRADALSVACAIEGLPIPAVITVATSAGGLEAAAREHETEEPAAGNPRVGEAMREVPLEVIAELGRISMGLRRVLSLRAGDVIRLSTATDDPVSVRVSGVEKFVGSPILSRGQLAVEIKARHER